MRRPLGEKVRRIGRLEDRAHMPYARATVSVRQEGSHRVPPVCPAPQTPYDPLSSIRLHP